MKKEDSHWLQENFIEKFLESSLVILWKLCLISWFREFKSTNFEFEVLKVVLEFVELLAGWLNIKD